MVVDDEEMATKVIQAHMDHIPDFEIVGIYHSAVEAFFALDSREIDVLFLDIQMPKITGLEMIKMLKHKPLTVLTTAHREYALEGFELEVVDYLMKPIGLHRFLQTISRIKKQLQLPVTEEAQEAKELAPAIEPMIQTPQHIFVRTNRAYQKIDFETILHIESIKNHIKIVTLDDTYISLVALSEFAQELPSHFLRIHRSFIVNTQHIQRFDHYAITHIQRELPIGRTYKEEVLEYLRQL